MSVDFQFMARIGREHVIEIALSCDCGVMARDLRVGKNEIGIRTSANPDAPASGPAMTASDDNSLAGALLRFVLTRPEG